MRSLTLIFSCAVALSPIAATVAQADTLLIDRVRSEHGLNLPSRGMSMAQVESRYGAPQSRLAPAGGDSQWHPTINRWVYPNYTVYFERDRVIDAVANHATATEVGPKNAVQNK